MYMSFFRRIDGDPASQAFSERYVLTGGDTKVNIKTLLSSAVLVSLIAPFVANPQAAHAIPTVRISTGVTVIDEVADGDPDDLEPMTGQVVDFIFGSIAAIGETKPSIGSPQMPQMNTTVLGLLAAPDSVTIEFSESGFTPSTPASILDWTASITGAILASTSTTVTYKTFLNPGNTLFGTDTAAGAILLFESGPLVVPPPVAPAADPVEFSFNSSGSTLAPLPPVYSLTTQITISSLFAGSISAEFSGQPSTGAIPEPLTTSLGLISFASLAFLTSRRQRTAAA
jgi:hypothetical protein